MEIKHTPTPWTVKQPTAEQPRLRIAADVELALINQVTAPGQANAAFIVRAVNCHEELMSALHEIAAMEGQTLLGECCVARKCFPTEYSSCALQEKVNAAFNQAAASAKRAIAKAEGK